MTPRSSWREKATVGGSNDSRRERVSPAELGITPAASEFLPPSGSNSRRDIRCANRRRDFAPISGRAPRNSERLGQARVRAQWWIQVVVATRPCGGSESSSVRASRGVAASRRLRGRSLSLSATNWR